MNPIPGFGGAPSVVAPPPVPTREDPAIAASRKKLATEARKRRGRRAANLTGDLDELGAANVVRPSARGGATLGA